MINIDNIEIQKLDNGILSVDIKYPRLEGHINTVTVGIECVRAADELKIRYDYDRNGYSIMMDKICCDYCDHDVVVEDDEVAFIPAWNVRDQKTK